MKSGNVLLGVLAGLAAGAAAGILYAPDKGTQTRSKILSKGNDYADGLKQKFNKFSDSVNRNLERTREEGEDLMLKGKAKYNNVKNNVKNEVKDAKSEVKGALS